MPLGTTIDCVSTASRFLPVSVRGNRSDLQPTSCLGDGLEHHCLLETPFESVMVVESMPHHLRAAWKCRPAL